LQQGSRFFMQISALWLNGCDLRFAAALRYRAPLGDEDDGSSLVERAFVDWKC
jgi:hypothetical protein